MAISRYEPTLPQQTDGATATKAPQLLKVKKKNLKIVVRYHPNKQCPKKQLISPELQAAGILLAVELLQLSKLHISIIEVVPVFGSNQRDTSCWSNVCWREIGFRSVIVVRVVFIVGVTTFVGVM